MADSTKDQKKRNFAISGVPAETVDHLTELFAAAEGTNADVLTRIVPAIEAALAVDVPATIRPDLEAFRTAMKACESRVNAIAAQYTLVKDDCERSYQERLSALLDDLSVAKGVAEVYKADCERLEKSLDVKNAKLEEAQARIDELEDKLAELTAQLDEKDEEWKARLDQLIAGIGGAELAKTEKADDDGTASLFEGAE